MDVYQIITDRIIARLEAGVVPWQRPWGGADQQPRNAISHRPYRGINTFLLAAAGYGSPWWLTWRQADQLGGVVRKGEHGTPVAFWKWLDPKPDQNLDPDADEPKGRPLLRYYTVFNAQQCDGLPPAKVPLTAPPDATFDPIPTAAAIVAAMPHPPTIRHGGNRAFYRAGSDTVTVPPPEAFAPPTAYYETMFHELIHSTGHKSRLHRPDLGRAGFGSDPYAREELVAAMGAAFLCGHAGILMSTEPNTASYIGEWLRRLRHDRRLVVTAASAAQKAADFILGAQWRD